MFSICLILTRNFLEIASVDVIHFFPPYDSHISIFFQLEHNKKRIFLVFCHWVGRFVAH